MDPDDYNDLVMVTESIYQNPRTGLYVSYDEVGLMLCCLHPSVEHAQAYIDSYVSYLEIGDQQ